jgi:hypothetical protein
MPFKNRLGQDNFYWWTGVVEDSRGDPLNAGRCKVRIFGAHTDDLNLIPSEDLPWAMPLKSPNISSMYTPLREGQYVMGYFNDGAAGQMPVIVGVFPGIPQSEADPKTNKGFNQYSVLFNDPAKVKFYTEKTPAVPEAAPALNPTKVGQPDTPANAYTANGTMVAVTNSDLVHACDFRFLINFGDFNIGTIENPITLIKQSIANAKNKAAAMIRMLLAQLLSKFRLGLKGIIIALNLDPTGNLAKIFSDVKDAIRTINYYSRKLAEVIGNVALVIALVQELKQIIEWIKSLPKKILALLRDCLLTFQNAVKSATSQITAIPGQVNSSVLGAFQSLQTSTESTISQAESAAASANIPNTLIALITSPDTGNTNVLTQYITSEYPNANVIISNTESSTFNVANSSTP